MRRFVLLAAVLWALIASPGEATFPGANGMLLYEHYFTPDVGSGGTTVLESVRPDGTGRRMLRVPSPAAEPSFAAAGGRVAYTTAYADEIGERFEHNAELWVMRADGTGRRRITHDAFADFGPSLSPDGRTIAFSSVRIRHHAAEIFTIDTRTRRIRRLTNSGADDSDPDFSPEGRRIAWAGPSGIWVMNRDGSDKRRLSASGTAPSWSPDGTQIAYQAGEAANTSAQTVRAEVWVMNSDGSNAHQVTHTPDGAFEPAFSPDGRLIAYASFTELRTVSPDGSGDQLVTSVPDDPNVPQRIFEPAWQPLPG